jgi:hypothetical protein
MIGFGEAAQAFAEGMGVSRPAALCGYDLKTSSDSADIRAAKAADFGRFDVTSAASGAQAVRAASAVISLVTADRSLAAAVSAAEHIQRGGLFFDGNSAEEMREVVATLEELGVTPAMSRATVAWQAAVGAAGLKSPPEGYTAKLAAIRNAKGLP